MFIMGLASSKKPTEVQNASIQYDGIANTGK